MTRTRVATTIFAASVIAAAFPGAVWAQCYLENVASPQEIADGWTIHEDLRIVKQVDSAPYEQGGRGNWFVDRETTITGVNRGVNPVTRIATVTPATGAPIVVQFAFNAGGPCKECLGSGRSGPTFAETITEGSTWTLTYTTSVPAGAATWFPGGTVNTVFRAVAVKPK